MKTSPATKTLGEVCEVIAGQSPEGKYYNTSGEGMPFYQGKKEFGERFVDEPTTWTTQTTKTAKADDILMSVRAPVGPVNITRNDICIGRGLAAIRVGSEINRDFLYYQLLYLQPEISGKEGAVFASINKTDIQNLRLRVFLLKDQKRIVQKLDEAFAGIAKAKENAEKNLQNARALFESHLQSVFSQRGPGWADKKLEEVCGFQNGFAFKSNTFKTMGAPIIRISNIQEGRIDTENRLVFFNPKDYGENLDRYRIVKGDLLIAMSGATTGKLGFNTEDTAFYLNQRVGKFEPGKHLDKRYLYYFLSTRVEENLRISAGAAQPNLSTEQIKGFVIPLPPINEQKRIVERLDNLADQTQRFARLYEQKLEALVSLKKSILHEAFSGNL
ncbi:MAG: restriction endonuclease subunit S [Bacteroidetes bacterium]|nr:restriction endonuclease subunit S [Bacteroidota bacterium]